MSDDSFKIVFLPGSLDGLDITQEELDELVAEIKAKFEDGTLFEESEDIDFEDLSPELQKRFIKACEEFDAYKEGKDLKKKLN